MKTKFEWKNRDDLTCLFEFVEPGKLKLTGYNSSVINITEENNSARFKKNNPLRPIVPVTVEYIGGPYMWIGQNCLDFFVTYQEFLDSEYRLICKKIDVQGPITYIYYDKKFIKKDSKTIKENSIKENKPSYSQEEAD